jgi:hypothetical protein
MNESQFVAWLFVVSCLFGVYLFHLWEVSSPEPLPPQRLWFTAQPISRKQTRFFFTQTKVEKQPIDVLDTLPVVFAIPFRVVDAIWETSISATALTIKAVFLPQILTYRMIKRHIA